MYVQGYLYVTTTFADIGYGDDFVRTSTQMILSMIGCMFGAVMFVAITRSVAHQAHLEASTDIQQEREELHLWLARREQQLIAGHIKREFMSAIEDFNEFNTLSNVYDHFHGHGIFLALPQKVQDPLMSYVFDDFQTIFSEFFDGIEQACANYLTSRLIPIGYPPKATILAPYEDSPGILFIMSGYAKVRTAENVHLMEAEQTFVGESILLGHLNKYKVSVPADVNLCALLLPEHAIEQVLDHYPVSAAKLRDLAERRSESLHVVRNPCLASSDVFFSLR